jgi:hypothetical protein
VTGSAARARRVIAALAAATVTTAYGAGPAAPRPLVIAPVIEGLMACEPRPLPEYAAMVHERSPCSRHGRNATLALRAVLDELEPGGPHGDVQIGYTLTVQLLSLYRLRDGAWQIDDSQIDRMLALVRDVPRPVVLYLAANHFDTPGAITESLIADRRNLMQLADGSVPHTSYFGYRVVPYTLLPDEAIPVNRYRFAALRHIAARIAALPAAARDRVVAITLAGEVPPMFPDFEGGMGRYQSVRFTDYSEASVAGFRAWLKGKYATPAALQAATGVAVRSFDEVAAPGQDLLAPGAKGHRSRHFDAHADGRVPVSGWLWDAQRQVSALELQVDGRPVAALPVDFNRLDVYRAIEGVDDPSIGFRHELDVSAWPPGRYAVQVVARTAAGPQEVARRLLEVVDGPQRAGLWASLTAHRGKFAAHPALALAGVRASLDLPQAATLRVLYNPLAREWNAYRASQVNDYLARFHAIALAAGLPADRLYSHQIVPRVNSSWNPQFFAVDASLDGKLPWKTGFNVYGGATGGGWVERFVKDAGLRDYGLPEFHPQQWKRPDAAARALALHRRLGARFISPYYLSVVADREAPPTAAVKRLEIRANNPLDGSDQLYRAIREAARQ